MVPCRFVDTRFVDARLMDTFFVSNVENIWWTMVLWTTWTTFGQHTFRENPTIYLINSSATWRPKTKPKNCFDERLYTKRMSTKRASTEWYGADTKSDEKNPRNPPISYWYPLWSVIAALTTAWGLVRNQESLWSSRFSKGSTCLAVWFTLWAPQST